jgi:hypothetical protein
LTIAAMVESVSRNGNIRYGHSFLGRVVSEYLGRVGAIYLTPVLGATFFLVLLAFYLAIANQLTSATGIPVWVWPVVLFVIGVFFTRSDSLKNTITASLVIGAVNITLIVVISLLALGHLNTTYLTYVHLPFIGGQPFDPSLLQLIFGVILVGYFGHTSTVNGAKTVLHRDPSGKALMWGSVAAQIAAMALYCLWVLAANSAIPADTLAATPGTALEPLSAIAGDSVKILGTIFVILAPGLTAVHISRTLFNLIHEWLPRRRAVTVALARRQGRLVFKGNNLTLGLIYLGLDGQQAVFRWIAQLDGSLKRFELPIGENFGAAQLSDRLPELNRSGVRLHLSLLQAQEGAVRLQVESSLPVEQIAGWDTSGVDVAGLLDMADSQRDLLTWMMRQKEATAAQVAAYLGQDVNQAQATLDALLSQSLIREIVGEGNRRYQVTVAPRAGSRMKSSVWQALEADEVTKNAEDVPESSLRRWLESLGERQRTAISLVPLALALILTEWMILTHAGSFAGLLSVAGLILAVSFGGIYPTLLLVASRRKGEMTPSIIWRFLGNPPVIGTLYVVFLAALFLHGLVIWQDPFQRAAVLVVGVVLAAMTIRMVRLGAFAPRTVVEIRQENDQPPRYHVHTGDQPTTAQVDAGIGQQSGSEGELGSLPEGKPVVFQLAGGQKRGVKVWAYHPTPEGDAEALPVVVKVRAGTDTAKEYDLRLSEGQVVLPVSASAYELEVYWVKE